MLYEPLKEWLSADKKEQQKIVILHSSVVNFNEADLYDSFFLREKNKVSFLICDDTAIELSMLLSDSNATEEIDINTKRNAALLLRNVALLPLDFVDLLDPSVPSHPCIKNRWWHPISAFETLFVFGDDSYLDMFLTRYRYENDRGSILIPNRNWRYGIRDKAHIEKIKDCNWKLQTSMNTAPRFCRVDEFNQLRTLTLRDRYANKRTLPISALQKKQMARGRFAQVFQADDEALARGNLVKFFIRTRPNRDGAAKIYLLQQLAPALPNNIAAVKEVLIDDAGDVFGFSMKAFHHATNLHTLMYIGWHDSGVDRQKLFQSIAKTLLELHFKHIVVCDLSSSNILVGRDSQASIVDVDSMQVCDYPGGPGTAIYSYPFPTSRDAYTHLRHPVNDVFSMIVLLFQVIVGADPLVGYNDDDEEWDWETGTFLLEPEDDATNPGYSEDVFNRWLALPYDIRKFFCDIFHFRRLPSIGSVAREFDLLDKKGQNIYRAVQQRDVFKELLEERLNMGVEKVAYKLMSQIGINEINYACLDENINDMWRIDKEENIILLHPLLGGFPNSAIHVVLWIGIMQIKEPGVQLKEIITSLPRKELTVLAWADKQWHETRNELKFYSTHTR